MKLDIDEVAVRIVPSLAGWTNDPRDVVVRAYELAEALVSYAESRALPSGNQWRKVREEEERELRDLIGVAGLPIPAVPLMPDEVPPGVREVELVCGCGGCSSTVEVNEDGLVIRGMKDVPEVPDALYGTGPEPCQATGGEKPTETESQKCESIQEGGVA